MQIVINDGFAETQRVRACELYWEAFRAKLNPVMKPETKALRFLNHVVDPSHAISASDETGSLVGIAGYKTSDGALVGGELQDLQSIYGWSGGLWRGMLLSLLERPLAPKTLLMDGIFVDASARGLGVGSKLLAAVKTKGSELGCKTVRLDVIDTNPRARALYERQGFAAVETSYIGPFQHIFGFRKSTTMVCKIDCQT